MSDLPVNQVNHTNNRTQYAFLFVPNNRLNYANTNEINNINDGILRIYSEMMTNYINYFNNETNQNNQINEINENNRNNMINNETNQINEINENNRNNRIINNYWLNLTNNETNNEIINRLNNILNNNQINELDVALENNIRNQFNFFNFIIPRATTRDCPLCRHETSTYRTIELSGDCPICYEQVEMFVRYECGHNCMCIECFNIQREQLNLPIIRQIT